MSTQPVAPGNTVVIVDFNLPIDAGSATLMSRVVSTAQRQNAAAIVVEMNTPGGSLSDMLSIVSPLRKPINRVFQHSPLLSLTV